MYTGRLASLERRCPHRHHRIDSPHDGAESPRGARGGHRSSGGVRAATLRHGRCPGPPPSHRRPGAARKPRGARPPGHHRDGRDALRCRVRGRQGPGLRLGVGCDPHVHPHPGWRRARLRAPPRRAGAMADGGCAAGRRRGALGPRAQGERTARGQREPRAVLELGPLVLGGGWPSSACSGSRSRIPSPRVVVGSPSSCARCSPRAGSSARCAVSSAARRRRSDGGSGLGAGRASLDAHVAGGVLESHPWPRRREQSPALRARRSSATRAAPTKPRKTGLTQVLDKGLSIAEVEGMLEVAASYVDIVKFGWATSVVVENFEAKLETFRRHGIDVCCGGSLFELAVHRKQLNEYIAFLSAPRLQVRRGLGRHHPDPARGEAALTSSAWPSTSRSSPRSGARTARTWSRRKRWVDQIKSELAAGSWKVIVEGRESGTVGIYHSSGRDQGGADRRDPDAASTPVASSSRRRASRSRCGSSSTSVPT